MKVLMNAGPWLPVPPHGYGGIENVIATLVPELRKELAAFGRSDILIVVGGVIPEQDFDELRAAGAAAIFPPGTVIATAALQVLDALAGRSG